MSSLSTRPLPFDQVVELLRFAALDEPSPGGTLSCSPLGYHGLLQASSRDGMPLWMITPRGRAWIEANDHARAARAATVKRVSSVQLSALRAIVGGYAGAVGTQRTYAALYDRGLIDWSDRARSRWTLTAAGAALLAGSTS